MERSRGLLLVAGLLAALLPAAAAAFGPQPGAPCEPTLLAPQVALFCAPDFSTQCCEPVVPAINLSGCVPCVCRVPAEPQLVMAGLNATHFLTPYSSCGRLHPGGAHLAAACEVVGHAPLGAVFGSFTRPSPPRRKLQELKCDPFSLGSKLVSACGDDQHPSLPCCEFIINTVDEYCVCDVIEVTEVTSAGISVSMIWTFYSICGGTRPIPADTTVCHEQSPPPPPPGSRRIFMENWSCSQYVPDSSLLSSALELHVCGGQ
uniref:Bifunctional inhibitor/plant lipid transfer protein/seed storage helical domain-containing protein n=1 Tax=Aegilops tauschii TaxID=37682 RepID=M8BIC4_AEGTA